MPLWDLDRIDEKKSKEKGDLLPVEDVSSRFEGH
jgi:hypothetical protein